MNHLDCLLRMDDCEFDHSGIACQAHTTRFEVRGGKVHTKLPRSGKVGNPFHEEIEFGSNYTGVKKQSISIKGLDYSIEDGTPLLSLFKINYALMQNVHFDLMEIKECSLNDNDCPSIHVYHPGVNAMNIQKVILKDNTGMSETSFDFTGDNVNIEELISDNSQGVMKLTNVKVQKMKVSDHLFGENNSRFSLYVNTVIKNLTIKDSKANQLGVNGIFRDGSCFVDELNLINCEFESSGQNVIFEAKFMKINMDNVKFNASSVDGLHDKIFYCRGSERTDIVANNILLRSKGPVSPTHTPFISYESTVLDGYVYLNNVRYEYIATPAVINFDPSKVIKLNCEPLFITAN